MRPIVLVLSVLLVVSCGDDGSSEKTVRYTAGWNGAAYDSPYSLWLAPIPPR
jgi:hypothetical protein